MVSSMLTVMSLTYRPWCQASFDRQTYGKRIKKLTQTWYDASFKGERGTSTWNNKQVKTFWYQIKLLICQRSISKRSHSQGHWDIQLRSGALKQVFKFTKSIYRNLMEKNSSKTTFSNKSFFNYFLTKK